LVNATPVIKLTDGSTKCPPDYSTTPPSSTSSGTSPSAKTIICYAKVGMIVREPSIPLGDGSTTCPSGYSTSKNTAKQFKINCVAMAGSNVSPRSILLYGIGKSPTCPKGYKKQ
jgi:hypothetical protein